MYMITNSTLNHFDLNHFKKQSNKQPECGNLSECTGIEPHICTDSFIDIRGYVIKMSNEALIKLCTILCFLAATTQLVLIFENLDCFRNHKHNTNLTNVANTTANKQDNRRFECSTIMELIASITVLYLPLFICCSRICNDVKDNSEQRTRLMNDEGTDRI